jgi:hypothetical protein
MRRRSGKRSGGWQRQQKPQQKPHQSLQRLQQYINFVSSHDDSTSANQQSTSISLHLSALFLKAVLPGLPALS